MISVPLPVPTWTPYSVKVFSFLIFIVLLFICLFIYLFHFIFAFSLLTFFADFIKHNYCIVAPLRIAPLIVGIDLNYLTILIKLDRDGLQPPCSLGLPFDDFIIFGSIISYDYPLQESCFYSFARISGDYLLMLMKVPVLIISECFSRLKPLDTAHWKKRLKNVVTTAIDCEAKHKECVRVFCV